MYLKHNFAFAVPPFIHHGELELSVVENSQAQLVCLTEGVPQPTLSWEKDGKPLTESTGEYTILPSGELVIDVAQVSKKKLSIALDRLLCNISPLFLPEINVSLCPLGL